MMRFRQSMAKVLLADCAEQLKHELDHGRKPTKAMDGGSLLDALVFERADLYEVVEARYKSGPRKGELCTSWAPTEAATAHERATSMGLLPVLPCELSALMPQVKVLRDRIREWIGYGSADTQRTVQWTSAIGTECEGTPDVVSIGADGVVRVLDLKRTASIHPRAVQRQVFAMHWHMQAAAYREAALRLAEDAGVDSPRYGGHWLLLAETAGRKRVLLRQLDDDCLALGQRAWERAQGIWRLCVESGEWPGYPEDAISPPDWMLSAEEGMGDMGLDWSGAITPGEDEL